jgi:microcystin-dependent protein
LICDGIATYSTTTYAALFAVVGYTYGGAGAAFAVPDLRNRVVAGKDYDVGGLSNRLTTAGSNINGTAINASGGNELLQQHLHAVTDPGHFHSVTDPGHAHNYYYNRNLTGYGLAYPNYANCVYTNDYGKAMSYEATGVSIQSKVTGISIQNQGGGTTSSQNVQPTIILNYIIRT